MVLVLTRAWDDFSSRTNSLPFWTLWAATTAVATLVGPFGTFVSMGTAERALYWSIVIGVAMIMGTATRSLVEHALPQRGLLLRSFAMAFLFSAVFTPPLYVFNLLVGGLEESPMKADAMFLAVFLIALAIKSVEIVIVDRFEPEAPVMAEDGALPRLLSRLPDSHRGQLIRMSVSDHYVNVVTDRGETRLLMRFRDAIGELDGTDGMQVHRSHWVAADAVEHVSLENGRRIMRTQDGADIPISCSRWHDVQARFPSIVREVCA
ncbi:MAG: LytTR family DNA-binding domain-containing protein [Pseudomonadota bacterium]